MSLVDGRPGANVKLVQISDSHLHAVAGVRLHGVGVDATLRKVVDHILANHGDARGVLHTGDLVQDDGPAAYARVRETLDRLRRPVWCLPGNHDDPLIMRTSLAAGPVTCPTRADLGTWQLHLLDTPLCNSPAGHISQSQLIELNAALAGDGRPAIIALHHPPVSVGTPWLDAIRLDNAPALIKVLTKHPQVKLVLFGHIHNVADTVIDGVRLLGSPSTAFQYRVGTSAPQVDTLPPGYRWLNLAPDGRFDTGVVFLH